MEVSLLPQTHREVKQQGSKKNGFQQDNSRCPDPLRTQEQEASKQGSQWEDRAWTVVWEGLMPVLGVTQWPWAKTLPHNISSTFHP